jgi:hypothetical protein
MELVKGISRPITAIMAIHHRAIGNICTLSGNRGAKFASGVVGENDGKGVNLP